MHIQDGNFIIPAVYKIFLCSYLFAACIVDDVYEHKMRSSPLQPSIWKEVHYDPEFSGYSVASLSQNESGWVAFGNLKGCIKLLKLNTAGKVIELCLL